MDLSGAVVAVDFDIVIGEVAAPGGGFLVPHVHVTVRVYVMLGKDFQGLPCPCSL